MRFTSALKLGAKLLALAPALAMASLLICHGLDKLRLNPDILAIAALCGLAATVALTLLPPTRRKRTPRAEAGKPRGAGAQPSVAELERTIRALEARNAELEKARQRAEARIEIKSRFLAQMSHELRTPMNGILGFAELLAKTPLAEYQLDKLRLIERSAKILLETINEILDLAKVEAEKFSFKPERFPLRATLEDTVALLSPKAKALIVLCVEPAVPGTLYGDPIRLQQVLANLLGNAVKFADTGKIVVRVRQDRAAPSRLLFTVSDTGQGIAPERRAELFSPFSQLVNRAPNGERGTGLGLSIAMTMVERMGGNIGVVSKPGKGSTFWFTHPLDDVPTEPPCPQAGPAAVVDSDPLCRAALRYQLESLGAQVECFPTLDAFARRHPSGFAGRPVFIGALGHAKPTGMAEQAKAAGARPIFILPHSSRRVREHYRAKGASCLWHPARSDALAEILSARPAPPPRQDRHRAAPSLHGKVFLVVDDNEINRQLLGARLSGMGARVLEAGDGPRALAYLRARPFDLVFMDIRMPRMSGLDVVRELLLGELSPNHNTPFIAVTAAAEEEERVSIAQAGFAELLLKPLLEEPLFRALARFLDTTSNRTEPSASPARDPLAEGQAFAFLERCGGNHALAQSLAEKLALELEDQLHDIQAALQDRNYPKAREAAHRVHGSAAFCGLRGIRSEAAALEKALAQSPAPDQLDRLARRLVREIERFLENRERLQAALKAPETARPMALG
jgi:two-component system sensor histidine kinase BarA